METTTSDNLLAFGNTVRYWFIRIMVPTANLDNERKKT
jgi:hypothetical protein